MRYYKSEVTNNGYNFLLEYDNGGPNGGDFTCWIYLNHKPLKDKQGYQVRRCFGDKYNTPHYYNFIKKFATNADYRNQYLENTFCK